MHNHVLVPPSPVSSTKTYSIDDDFTIVVTRKATRVTANAIKIAFEKRTHVSRRKNNCNRFSQSVTTDTPFHRHVYAVHVCDRPISNHRNEINVHVRFVRVYTLLRRLIGRARAPTFGRKTNKTRCVIRR